jgi:hypothetical protein
MMSGPWRRQERPECNFPRTYLQQAVALGIQRVLEFHHILILLRIDELIREIDGEILQLELHWDA